MPIKSTQGFCFLLNYTYMGETNKALKQQLEALKNEQRFQLLPNLRETRVWSMSLAKPSARMKITFQRNITEFRVSTMY